jgi:hypothetical protein
MTADKPASSNVGTTSADYNGAYYEDPHLAGYADYGWESDEWREFFTGLARRIVGMFEPADALDVGCAKGMLVQALTECGVDARGIDISDFAIDSAHPDVRDRLSVGSATDALDGRFDLITCIEVLEHMSPGDAQKAIDSMCAASDRILFSSTPGHFDEATHINVHPTAQWAAWFAERGFFRRTDLDLSFLTSWAVVFERDELSKRDIVDRYESQLAPLNLEVIEKRRALLELRRQLAAAPSGARVVHLDDDTILARHAELAARDNVIGLEATITRLENDLRTARSRITRLRDRVDQRTKEVEALKASRTWRIGRMFTGRLGSSKG